MLVQGPEKLAARGRVLKTACLKKKKKTNRSEPEPVSVLVLVQVTERTEGQRSDRTVM